MIPSLKVLDFKKVTKQVWRFKKTFLMLKK